MPGTPDPPAPRPRLHLDVRTERAVPLHEQLRAQMAVNISSGRLSPGAHLPTIRALAAELGCAPGTVARAYAELERDGLVTGRRRAGTVVTERPPNSQQLADHRERLGAALSALATHAAALGLSSQAVHRLVDDALSTSDEASD